MVGTLTNRLILRNLTGKALVVVADNTSYSNGFEIAAGGGAVTFETSAAWGPLPPAASKTLIQAGGYLSTLFPLTSTDLTRLDSASAGMLGIDVSTSVNIDLSPSGLNIPALLIGGNNAAVYTGILTPHGSVYRFGGAFRPSDPYIGTLQLGDGTPARDNLLTGARSVMVVGSPANISVFRLHVRNNNNYTGGTIVGNRGLLSLGRTGGTPFGSGRVNVLTGGAIGACSTNGTFWDGTRQFTNYLLYAGAGIVLDENLFGVQNYTGINGGHGRWGDSASMALNGGYLLMVGGLNNTYTESVHVVTFSQGSALRFKGGGGTSRYFLQVTNLSRSGRATLNVEAVPGGDFRVRYATPPPLMTNGLVAPWMLETGSGRHFLTYSNTTDAMGVIGLTTNGVYTRTSTTALNDPPLPTDNVNQTSGIGLNNSPTVHALRLAGALTGPAYTVTITSGALSLTGNNQTHTANFNFGEAEAVIWLADGFHFINGTITANNGLTKAGGNALMLGTNNAATIKGPIHVMGGRLQLNHATALGQTNDLFVGYGASLYVNAQTTLRVGKLGGDGTVHVTNKTLIVHGELDPATAEAPGSLTVLGTTGGAVSFASTASMVFDLTAPSLISDQLVVSNANVNIDGVPVTIRNFGGLQSGTYTLIDVTGGTMIGTPGTLTMPDGLSGRLSVVNQDLMLEVRERASGTLFILR